MGTATNTVFLVLLSLVAVPLATISSKSNNDILPEGDKVKQAKVLELLDQYVLHVDKGRTDDNEQVLDLLDQYVMHVDRGADVSIEELEKRKGSASSHVGWSWNMGQQQLGDKGQEVSNKNDERRRTGVNKIRRINRVRRHLRAVQKNSVSNVLQTKRQLISTRSLQEFKEKERNLNYFEYKTIQNGPVNELNLGSSRFKRNAESRNKGSDKEKESERDLTAGLWTHSVKLDPNVTLSWKVLNESADIEFLVEAATRGYVGVGFSPGGGMAGSDIILGWVDDSTGKIYLVDAHGLDSTGAPVADPEQDCILLGGKQNDSHTVIRFRRALDTCDNNHDLRLGGDTVRMIYATHDRDPTLDDGELVGMSWHGKENRGVRSLHLLTPAVKRGIDRGPQIQHWNVTLRDFVVPDNMDTLYWCKIFKVPAMNRKHHMIGYEPVLQPGNERYVHHMLLYECVAPHQFTSSDAIFQKYVTHPGASCYSSTMPQQWDWCMTAIVAWAVGSQGEFLPEHVGLPLADGDKARYFMLEIHYDNPGFRKVRDNSGIRIHYTENLRQYDGGILVNGITITPLHIVPPHQPEYRTAGYCSSECTNRMFPETGIKLVSVVLHSHLAGKKLRLRHIRNGQELPRVAEDDHYDFNYQQARVLPQEVSVLPGDELVTECVYQTPNRTEPTFGGYSTKQEMCLAFVLYYPRTQLAACYSMTPVKYFFETFGVRQFYDVDMDTVENMFLKLPLQDNVQGSNQVTRTTTTTTTTTSTTPSFPIGPAGAFDEETNERAILVLKQMKDFTVEAVEGGAGGAGGLFGELVIQEPSEFRNRSFTSHLVELPWTEKLLTQRVEESFYAGKHMVFCRMHDDQLAIPLAITTFPNFTELSEESSGNNSHCTGKVQNSLRIGNTAATLKINSVITILASICILRLQQ